MVNEMCAALTCLKEPGKRGIAINTGHIQAMERHTKGTYLFLTTEGMLIRRHFDEVTAELGWTVECCAIPPIGEKAEEQGKDASVGNSSESAPGYPCSDFEVVRGIFERHAGTLLRIPGVVGMDILNLDYS